MHGFVVGVLRGTVVAAAFGVVLVGLHAAGDGVLATPPTDGDGFAAWLSNRDPLIATASLLRIVALAISWYLTGLSLLTLLSRLTGLRVLAVLASSLSTPAVRRLTHGVVGVSLVAAVAVPTAPAMASPGVVGDGRSPSSSGAPEAGWRPPTFGEETATPPDPDPVELPSVRDRRPGPSPIAEEHVVERGESLWTIAADVVERRASRTVSDAEVAVYWRRLLEANRDRLQRPDDPDLILPGQRFTLPSGWQEGGVT